MCFGLMDFEECVGVLVCTFVMQLAHLLLNWNRVKALVGNEE